ncbi:hypothetical protein NDU88_002179 [Pleurodeles waltl]|uniref:Uncharacterized protein n=1 Tax=Pleurodeles waltl TaxID=8319 RepID=A0AAV7UUT6_PLEWA|nr:hypothetical protein NDU88_002179 [Pleurodeles waltl]
MAQRRQSLRCGPSWTSNDRQQQDTHLPIAFGHSSQSGRVHSQRRLQMHSPGPDAHLLRRPHSLDPRRATGEASSMPLVSPHRNPGPSGVAQGRQGSRRSAPDYAATSVAILATHQGSS